ncbi:hypothetical protein TNCV_4532561 [Trichonephila clavipes]|nr:hypothetical protein TNCV_4532561 [Trichonephila clavipes]
MSPTAPPAYSSSTNMNRRPPKEGSLTLEEKRFLVAVERGDLASTRRRFQRVTNSPTWSPMTSKWSPVANLVANNVKMVAKVANLVAKNDAILALPPRFRQVLIGSPL